ELGEEEKDEAEVGDGVEFEEEEGVEFEEEEEIEELEEEVEELEEIGEEVEDDNDMKTHADTSNDTNDTNDTTNDTHDTSLTLTSSTSLTSPSSTTINPAPTSLADGMITAAQPQPTTAPDHALRPHIPIPIPNPNVRDTDIELNARSGSDLPPRYSEYPTSDTAITSCALTSTSTSTTTITGAANATDAAAENDVVPVHAHPKLPYPTDIDIAHPDLDSQSDTDVDMPLKLKSLSPTGNTGLPGLFLRSSKSSWSAKSLDRKDEKTGIREVKVKEIHLGGDIDDVKKPLTSWIPAPVLVPVTFMVQHHGDMRDQNVYITGSIPALSSWSTKYAIPLVYDVKVRGWKVTLPLPPSTSFEYKYIRKPISSPAHAHAKYHHQVACYWDEGPNRSSSTSTSISRPTGLGNEKKNANAQGEKDVVEVRVNVYAETVWGENIYITGSSPALSSWSTRDAIKMKTTKETYPIWTATLHLPASTPTTKTTTEFKFIRKHEARDGVRWEAGENRVIQMGEAEGEGVVVDGVWRWMATNAVPSQSSLFHDFHRQHVTGVPSILEKFLFSGSLTKLVLHQLNASAFPSNVFLSLPMLRFLYLRDTDIVSTPEQGDNPAVQLPMPVMKKVTLQRTTDSEAQTVSSTNTDVTSNLKLLNIEFTVIPFAFLEGTTGTRTSFPEAVDNPLGGLD
ncbi:hypothetical protein CVT24_012995, partial [Panaeolus cyanescens]